MFFFVQDEMLGELHKGVTELHEIAKTLKQEIAVGSALADDLSSKTDALNNKLENANQGLDQLIQEVRLHHIYFLFFFYFF